MKTTLKIMACLIFMGTAVTIVAQQTATATPKKSKNQTKKPAKISDNKIAVSDQAMPAEKSTKGAPKKNTSAITNK